jgi:hypothetical protein
MRVEKSNASGGTLYWRAITGETIAETDLTGSTTNSAYREYIFFAGRRIAYRDSVPNVYFYYTDHLGSTTAITTASGLLQRPDRQRQDRGSKLRAMPERNLAP